VIVDLFPLAPREGGGEVAYLLTGEWRSLASCAGADPETFFPSGNGVVAQQRIAVAKSHCATCPVRSECGEFALLTHQVYGVWGGLDEEERRALRRRRERRGGARSAAAARRGEPGADRTWADRASCSDDGGV
jgi:WhiB family redox-sensing transcriptional regulator